MSTMHGCVTLFCQLFIYVTPGDQCRRVLRTTVAVGRHVSRHVDMTLRSVVTVQPTCRGRTYAFVLSYLCVYEQGPRL